MKYFVEEHIEINKPLKTVKEYVSNLNKWNEWSPWKMYDPNSKEEITKDENNKTKMCWKGKYVGDGCITENNIKEKEIKYKLVFKKPFKNKADTNFVFESKKEEKTIVYWKLESQLPFFLFFLKKMFTKFISKDYKRGLIRLKYILEEKKIPYSLEFVDTPFKVESFNFYGIQDEGFFSEMGTKMQKGFKEIENTTKNVETIYNYCFCEKIKITKDWLRFSMGTSIKDLSLKEAVNLKTKKIPNHMATKVIFKGDYKFIESAWASIMVHSRSDKFKALKTIPPYEKYVKGPNNTENPKDYITEIHFPIKEKKCC